MTRKGKVARLPHLVREQINRRLRNGEEGKQVAEWLNTLEETGALMAAEFDGEPINAVNISNWKLGGYRDWEAKEEALEAVRRFGGDAVELNDAAGGQLADQLALCLTARIAVALQRPFSPDDNPSEQLQWLRDLCSDLVALRKGDHNAQWLRIEREKLDLSLKKYQEDATIRKEECERRQRPSKGGITKETMKIIEKELKLL